MAKQKIFTFCLLENLENKGKVNELMKIAKEIGIEKFYREFVNRRCSYIQNYFLPLVKNPSFPKDSERFEKYIYVV